MALPTTRPASYASSRAPIGSSASGPNGRLWHVVLLILVLMAFFMLTTFKALANVAAMPSETARGGLAGAAPFGPGWDLPPELQDIAAAARANRYTCIALAVSACPDRSTDMLPRPAVPPARGHAARRRRLRLAPRPGRSGPTWS